MLEVIVLARPPRRGEGKRRLAAGVGDGPAARLARAMLRDTWESLARALGASGAPASCAVVPRLATTAPDDAYPLLLPRPRTLPQGDGDLGRRMARLVAGAHGRGADVLLLGSDGPALPSGHLDAALAALLGPGAGADLVLGAHADGGFWCLGARRGPAALADERWLDGLDWERGDTRAQVLARAQRLGLAVATAPEWFDVDRADDLPRLRELLRAHPERAPATWRVLQEPGLQRHAQGEPPPCGPDPPRDAPTPAGRAPRHETPPLAAERTRPAGEGASADASAPLLSIVVASLDEGTRLDECLEALRAQPGPHELIVADGGSRDGSAERAAAAPDVTVVVTPPGRGRQLAAGAALSTGEHLLFLHADARLPPQGARLVRETLSGGRFEAGAFVTHTRADPRLPNPLGPLLRLADLRSRLTRHPYGDQAPFVTRAAYEAVGGFRDQPIMEDWDLSVRLAARGPLARLRPAVSVSGRRMQARPLRTLLLLRLIPPLYRLGVDPERLARLYRGR